MNRSFRWSIAFLLVAVIVASCTASPASVTPASAPPPSPTVHATPGPTPPPTPRSIPSETPSASGEVEPTPEESPFTAPTRRPADPLPSPWIGPASVMSTSCGSVSALIDAAAASHIAAGCQGRVQYSVQVGTSWRSMDFSPPADREEFGPQLAFHGNLLYLAYTRIRVEEGGCGDSGLRDVGVYLRTRQLPSGVWSEARLIGETADHLQSFRVANGTIHATVQNADDGLTYYERIAGGSTSRYEIPRAVGDVSLRVGGDGAARIAYAADDALWYGVFNGTNFTRTEIPQVGPPTDRSAPFDPTLVLGAADRPYLLWRHGFPRGGGCIETDPDPDVDGTYFGTLVGGEWRSERLTSGQGAKSLTIDTATGEVHALINGGDGLIYVSKKAGGSWIRLVIDNFQSPAVVIRRDARSGALIVVYSGSLGDQAHVLVAKRP